MNVHAPTALRGTAAVMMLICLPCPATAQLRTGHLAPIDTLALRADTRFLSSDALQGRGTGTPGERAAATYIAGRMRELGLVPPPGAADFRQPVPLRQARMLAGTRAIVRAGPDSTTFRNDLDFVVSTGGAAAFRSFTGPALFMGTPEQAADSGGALRGAVVVLAGGLGAQATRLVPAWMRAGVAGMVVLVPDAERFALYASSRGERRAFLATDVDAPVWQADLPTIVAGPELTAALVRGVSIPNDFASREHLGPITTGRTIDVEIRTVSTDLPAANLAGILPGSDPVLRNRYVVYTAHYDHLGTGTPDSAGDSIYNGFSDNAAGVAMLLEIASALRDAAPRRSILFLFLTGEERGLLGSSYYASAPLLPLDGIDGLINLDAGAPPAPPVSWRIAGGRDTSLGALADSIAQIHGWTANLGDASPNSDYWPFLTRGVPAIFIIPGEQWQGVDQALHDSLKTRWDRYHDVDDEWHADFPFAGLARYAEYALEIGKSIADAPVAR